MVAGMDQGDSFIRDMGYSEKEFFRILPTAVPGYVYTVQDNRVTICGGGCGGQLTLVVKSLPDRRLGMIRIPRVEVEFMFRKFSAAERSGFMKNFDRSYQRGGG